MKRVTKKYGAPVQARAFRTRETLLQATERVLLKRGYSKATTNHIAAMAGVSIGSLYQYFPNKKSLVTALGERHAQEMIETIDAKLAEFEEAPLEIVIKETVCAFVEAHKINPSLHRVLQEEVPRESSQSSTHATGNLGYESLRAFLEKRKAEIRHRNLDLATFFVLRSVESIVHAAVLEKCPVGFDELGNELSSFICDYLKRTKQ